MALSFALSASPRQLFEHVVHAGQRQRRMRGLLALAVRVELFGEVADAGGLFGGGGGEGESSKQDVLL
jgi:hypothetical protein